MKIRVCKSCGENNPDKFSKQKSTRDGLRSRCKECTKLLFYASIAKSDRSANVIKKSAEYIVSRPKVKPDQQFDSGLRKTERGIIHRCGNQPCRPSDAGQGRMRATYGMSSLEFAK